MLLKAGAYSASQADQEWQRVQQSWNKFTDFVQGVKGWQNLSESQLWDKIPGAFKTFDDDLWDTEIGHPLDPSNPIGTWVRINLDTEEVIDQKVAARKWVREHSYVLRDALKEEDRVPLKPIIRDLIGALDLYAETTESFLRQAGPRRFTYQGFNVENPDRLTDSMVRQLLDGVDYVVALFKKKGVTPLLKATVKNILLRNPVEEESGRIHGQYHSLTRSVSLISSLTSYSGEGKMLQTWVHEVFLHELGHHVHMTMMHPEARKEWDSGWAPVREAEANAQRIWSVTSTERQKYWDILVTVKGDLRRVPLRGLDRIKFHAWLAKPLMGEGFVTKKQLRWNEKGLHFASLFADPVQYAMRQSGLPEGSPLLSGRIAWIMSQKKDNMGVGVDLSLDYPALSEEEVSEYAKSDTSVADAIKALQLPTSYAGKNELEDFAETFVLFMTFPEKLSRVSRYRMTRSLSLSGLYGKPILRLAQRIAQTYLSQKTSY